jgi:hypothetical protein
MIPAEDTLRFKSGYSSLSRLSTLRFRCGQPERQQDGALRRMFLGEDPQDTLTQPSLPI